jgi:hypothetical protein
VKNGGGVHVYVEKASFAYFYVREIPRNLGLIFVKYHEEYRLHHMHCWELCSKPAFLFFIHPHTPRAHTFQITLCIIE